MNACLSEFVQDPGFQRAFWFLYGVYLSFKNEVHFPQDWSLMHVCLHAGAKDEDGIIIPEGIMEERWPSCILSGVRTSWRMMTRSGATGATGGLMAAQNPS